MRASLAGGHDRRVAPTPSTSGIIRPIKITSMQALGHVNCVPAVIRLTHNLHVGRGNNRADPVAHNGVVVDQKMRCVARQPSAPIRP
jgi:hypothetical protein